MAVFVEGGPQRQRVNGFLETVCVVAVLRQFLQLFDDERQLGSDERGVMGLCQVDEIADTDIVFPLLKFL